MNRLQTYRDREAEQANRELHREQEARYCPPREPEPTKPPRFAYVVKVTCIDTVARESATFLDTMDGREAMAAWKRKQEAKA